VGGAAIAAAAQAARAANATASSSTQRSHSSSMSSATSAITTPTTTTATSTDNASTESQQQWQLTEARQICEAFIEDEYFPDTLRDKLEKEVIPIVHSDTVTTVDVTLFSSTQDVRLPHAPQCDIGLSPCSTDTRLL